MAAQAPTRTSALSVTTDALVAREKLIAAYDRAFARVIADKMVCFHDRENDTWAVPSTSTPGTFHTVTHNGGSDWANLSCSGPKCGHALACKHRAVVAYARKNHISAVLRCTPCDPRFCEGGCPDAPVASIEQYIADQQEAASESLDYLEAERERGYEAPASEDVIWEAEQVRYEDERSPESYFVEAEYYDQVQQERDGANALRDALMSEADPVHARQVALGRSSRAVTLDGASPAYLASLARDATKAQELSAERMAAWAAAPRESDPLADLYL